MARTPPTLHDPFGWGIVMPWDFRAFAYTAGVFGGANRGIFVRTMSGGTISKVRIQVGVQSGNISAAAYASTGSGLAAAPIGSPLASSGAIACPAPGKQDVALGASIAIAAGDWLFLSCDNTTATFDRLAAATATWFDGLAWRQDSAHPAPAVGTLAATSYIPLLIGVP